MTEKPFDLNKLREEALARQDKPVTPSSESGSNTAVNTLERFETLSQAEQEALMREKGYEDMELFKQRHYSAGEVSVDINSLREQVRKMKSEEGGE